MRNDQNADRARIWTKSAGVELCAAGAPRLMPGGNGCEQVIRRQFRSDDAATRSVLAEITGRLVAHGLTEDDLGNVELALAEALNNVTEHAYGSEGGMIELAVGIEPARIVCVLRDQGRPMPHQQPPQTSLPLIEPPDHLPEGGFGWHIIRCLVSDLGYDHDESGNRLTFILPLSAEIDS